MGTSRCSVRPSSWLPGLEEGSGPTATDKLASDHLWGSSACDKQPFFPLRSVAPGPRPVLLEPSQSAMGTDPLCRQQVGRLPAILSPTPCPLSRHETPKTPSCQQALSQAGFRPDTLLSWVQRDSTKPGQREAVDRREGRGAGIPGSRSWGCPRHAFYRLSSISFPRTFKMCQETPHRRPGLPPGRPHPVPLGSTSLQLWVRAAALAGRTRPAASPSPATHTGCASPTSGAGASTATPPHHPHPSLAAGFQCQLPVTLPFQRALPGQLVPARPPSQIPECVCPSGSTGDRREPGKVSREEGH